MRALILENSNGLNCLRYVEDRELPEPGRGEIRVKVKAVGLNPVDYKLADGWGEVDWKTAPVLGLDVAGIVDTVGYGVTEFLPGERVFYHGNLGKANGGYAEYACTAAHTASRLPESISFKMAAAIPCAGFTAYQAIIDKLKPDTGNTILVHAGAGGVGGYAIQLAKLRGLRVFTTCSARNDEYVKRLGADVVIHYSEEDVYERVMCETGGRGLDYVVNTIGSESATGDIDMLAFGGQLVAVVELPDFNRIRFYEKGLSIHEVALGAAHINGDNKAQRHLAEIGNAYVKMIINGDIKLPDIQKITLPEIPEALEKLKQRHVSGKIVATLEQLKCLVKKQHREGDNSSVRRCSEGPI